MATRHGSEPWLGPLVGAVLGVAVYRSAGSKWLTIEVAKLYHFGHDRYGVLRGQHRDRERVHTCGGEP